MKRINIMMVLSFVAHSFLFSEFVPQISIITSLYNGDEFIAGFLSDITRQTIFEDCELIIINANSPGNEEPIIREYMKKWNNIVYKKLDHDPGLYAVWNIAIQMAHGEYITNANLDDRRNPECLAIQARVLDENPAIELVYQDFYVTFIPNETFECNTHQYAVFPDDFSPNVMYKCLTGPQPMWRKNMHEKYGYFDESFHSAGDFEMWNRAAAQGSLFKKISFYGGLYYYNPQGLSTDSTKQHVQDEELQRINNHYYQYWIKHYHYYCTAADSAYFRPLLNLIGSIHATNFDNIGEIAIFDLGLTQEQIEYLRSIDKVSIHTIELSHPDILTRFTCSAGGKQVPGWYAWKFVILKQALDLYPYVLWLDAGTTVLKPLDILFNYIKNQGYFLSTMGDESFYNQIAHPIKWGTTQYVKEYFQLYLGEKKWVLDKEPLLSGVIGASRSAMNYLVEPLYKYTKNIALFQDDGSTAQGFGTGRHDQTILSIHAYLNGLTIHHEDHTQEKPIYLFINNNYEEFYITWNSNFVNSKTFIYNSRCALQDFEKYVNAIHHT